MARIALVLAGGAARGAYEVGVVQHIVDEVARDLGREVPLDILCGTSVGAINACMLAAYADEPRGRAQRLVDQWSHLRVDELVRLDRAGFVEAVRGLFGRERPPSPSERRRGGLLDPAGIERLISDHIPFPRIDEHLRAGRLHALTVSTTHVATGRTVVFVARQGALPAWGSDPSTEARAVALRADHALASAAIPFLFPAVRIEDQFHCDGGLRQNVPLSPARRLGADGLVVINPRYARTDPVVARDREQAFPGPLFLLGKTLNALLLDRIDSDIDRLNRINAILDAGARRYGPDFVGELNAALGNPPGKASLRPLRAVLIRASRDIGRLAAEFVRRPGFRRRTGGVLGRVLQALAEGDAQREADLLSYLLFDGEFASELIALGRADAARQHARLCALFDGKQ